MRQFVLPAPPGSDGSVELGAREFRYLVQVLRIAEGDLVDARLPDGRLVPMRITVVDRKLRRVRLVSDTPGLAVPSVAPAAPSFDDRSSPALSAPPEGFPRIILFQWILTGPKMDQVVRQATETGVSLIVPVAGDRCLTRDADAVGGGKTGRWDRIVREAQQQSGSPIPTRILPPVTPQAIPGLRKTLLAGDDTVSLVLTEAPLARKSLHEYLGTQVGLTALAVGPAGGMTVRELALLAEAGFVCVHFRTNILRAETAALYGIAAVQTALMESEKWQLKE